MIHHYSKVLEMKKKFFIIGIVFSLFSTSLMATAYKGQRVYAKNCVSCHGKGEYIQSKTAAQWDAVLGKRGEKLAKIHLASPKAVDAAAFFTSKKYKRNIRHLRDFLKEYAKDGKVPTCN